MAGYIIGLGVLAFALWRWWDSGVPDDAVLVTGTVIEELERTMSKPGPSSKVHAPRVAYRHPVTGEDEVFEPSTFGSERYTPGQTVQLACSPDRVRLQAGNRLRSTVVLVALGVGLIIAQWAA